MKRACLAAVVLVVAGFLSAGSAEAAPEADRAGIPCRLSWAVECHESAPPTTTTTAVVTTGTDDATVPQEESPGFFDVSGRVREAMNDWFKDLVDAAVERVLDLLDRLLLSTPDFTADGRVRDLWLLSWGIANISFVLMVVAAGALGMAHETLQSRHAVKELLPRLAVAWVAANASLLVAGKAIGFANALSGVFVHQGIGFEGAGSAVKLYVTSRLLGAALFVTLLALVVLVLALCLTATAIARVATVVVLIAGAPLFLLGHALPHTEGAARLWWRALVGCLSVQVAQALVLTTAVRVFFAPTHESADGLRGGALMDMLVVACLFWLMLRIPTYARRLVFAPRPNAGVSFVRHEVVGRATKAVGTAAKTALTA